MRLWEWEDDSRGSVGVQRVIVVVRGRAGVQRSIMVVRCCAGAPNAIVGVVGRFRW